MPRETSTAGPIHRAPRLPALRDDLIDDRFQLTQRAQNRRFAGSGSDVSSFVDQNVSPMRRLMIGHVRLTIAAVAPRSVLNIVGQ